MTEALNPAKGLRRALYVSVAINLLVVGTVAGMFVAHGFRGGPEDRGPGFGRYTAALSPEDRAALREAYRERIVGVRGAGDGAADPVGPRGRVKAERAELLTALRGDPFDPVAVAALFERQKNRMASGMELGQTLLLQRISAMSPTERAAFAARLEAESERDKGRGHDHQRDAR